MDVFANTPAGPTKLIRSHCPIVFGNPQTSGAVGSCIFRFGTCAVLMFFMACRLAKPRNLTYTESRTLRPERFRYGNLDSATDQAIPLTIMAVSPSVRVRSTTDLNVALKVFET